MSSGNYNVDECRIFTDFSELLSTGEQYSCIYADVPWEFQNQSSRGAASNHYRTMNLEEVKQFPVFQVATDNAHLHLWCPNALLEDGMSIVRAWGFEYKTNMVWVKPQLGLGNYWRSSHELLLLGVRGSLPFKVKNKRSWYEEQRTEHSTKPDSIREIVE